MHKYVLTVLLSSLLVVSLAAVPAGLKAQDRPDNTYVRANQLLQQREYERAFDLFLELHRDNPGVYVFYERATECLINMKKYSEAVELSRDVLQSGYYDTRARIRLGEIYHFKGDTALAYNSWEAVKKENPDNLQVYINLARAMRDRRAFDRAITTYRQALELFPGNSMLNSELANTYLRAGRYEESVRQYLQLLEKHPDRVGFVQTTLLRFDDDYLYDIAILEIGEFLEQLPQSHPSHPSLHQLEVWLLMERNLHKRALATALNYEESRTSLSYTLFSLGARLLAEQQFRLAEQAYRYYVNQNIQTAKYQSLEELAKVYTEWAAYLENYNLSSRSRRDSLYRAAYHSLQQIAREAPYYRNYHRVLIRQAELALNFMHKPAEAQRLLAVLEQSADSSTLSSQAYIRGRIHLYEQDYARARIAFSKSHRRERLGDLAEKTRYYLALSDFFSGEYDFARIQLHALERQNTSYFANDAVQLRVWIQEGLQADSTGKLLDPFAKAVEQLSSGKTDSALAVLYDLSRDGYHPLADEALLEMSTHLTPPWIPEVFQRIAGYLANEGRHSPLRERLMWEKARIAEQAATQKVPAGTKEVLSDAGVPASDDKLIALYEQIILEYPNGFYADFARKRIRNLQNIQS